MAIYLNESKNVAIENRKQMVIWLNFIWWSTTELSR